MLNICGLNKTIIVRQSVLYVLLVSRNMTVALILDLSKPAELWLTLEHWLDALRSRVSSALKDIRASTARERMEQEAWKRVGEDHDVCNWDFELIKKC